MAKPLILIGAGGHAKVVVDALASQKKPLAAYVDPTPAPWLEAMGVKRMTDAELDALLPTSPELVIGFVGLTTDALERRLDLMRQYRTKGAFFPAIIHASATIGSSVSIGFGAQILAASVINPFAAIKDAAIINTAAIIEHDAIIGEGAHIAPRAVVLGNARIGDTSIIGSNAVVIQGSIVKARSFVKALSVHK